MVRYKALAVLAAGAVATSGAVALPADAATGTQARPASYCSTLHQQVEQAYATYRWDIEKYGSSAPATVRAYKNYRELQERYAANC